MEMYLIHNEGKYGVIGRFIRALKNNHIHHFNISVSKNVYIDKLDDILKTQQSHRIFKMKLFDVKTST